MSDVSLLITSGSGPAECHQAVAGILRQMVREAEVRGVELNAHGVPTKHGLRSAVVLLHGDLARELAAPWIGTILWRSKSALRPGHRRLNWFIGVFDLPLIARPEGIALQDVVFESFRAGGPGGQHQNTTDSAIRATHAPTGLTAVARDMRSQHRNRALALQRLERLIAMRHRVDEEERKTQSNQLHKALERGNPVRVFKGPGFREVR